ncbi:MAG: conditioned medium factor [Acidobacteria bacterium]|nr:conditioned medium factor [Acidobacteriota bacterium]
MNLRRLSVPLSLVVLLVPALAALGIGGPTDSKFPAGFKQLAGPPEEMASMKVPEPAELGVRSRSAMIRVQLPEGAEPMSLRVPIDSTDDLKLLLFAPDSPAWQLSVTQPGKISYDLRRAPEEAVRRQTAAAGVDGTSYPAEVFSFASAKSGVWNVKLSAPEGKRAGGSEGFLVVSSRSPYRLYSYVDTHDLRVGNEIGFVTALFDSAKSPEEAVSGAVHSAVASIRLPNGAVEEVELQDAGQGRYRARFVASVPGEHTAQVIVRGVTPEGKEFIRTSEHVCPVVALSATLGENVSAAPADDTRLRIALPVSGVSPGMQLLAHAEVWGTGPDGQRIPLAWIGGMSVVEGTTLPVALDGRWISRAGARRPFELRNVRITDPNTYVPVATAESVALSVRRLPPALRADERVDEITDDMLMGPAPSPKFRTNAVAPKGLLLVHGYCSGSNPWPSSQFTSAASFLDPNASRTHDDFARRIRDFGATKFNSYGIVAHSQGGCASLHLYSYYWSGLDSATGNRLIQSVGTPYQGTALAGNLAILGQIFGAGCGSNYDLTYSGAAAWLASIPSWARAKVHYFTTSETEVWWRWDYCQVATEPFLSDPEDGVVEKAKGQLPGANNRGHKEGWCHTSSMRDPAQTSDSSRNAEMNANAAR